MRVTGVSVTEGNWGDVPPLTQVTRTLSVDPWGFCIYGFRVTGRTLFSTFFVMSWVLPIGSSTRGFLHSPVRSGNLPGTVPLRPRGTVIHRYCILHLASLLSMPCLGYAALKCSV